MTRSEGRREGKQTMLIKELHSEDAETRDGGRGGARRRLAALGGACSTGKKLSLPWG